MAAIWKGAISFGLVNIPVELRSAVKSDGDGVHFRQLHNKDLSPIKYDRVCTAEDKPVPWAEIVKGYEYTKGKFVVVTDEELKAAAAATKSTKALDILDFVKESEIDPRYFETPYFLVPQKGGERAYALLREAIRRTGMVGIGKFTMRQKEQLASVKAVGDALMLEVMRFGAELIDPSEYTFPSADVKPQEVQMAEQLIASLAEPFDPSKYTDDYRDGIMKVIKAKLKGKKIEVEEEPEPAGTQVLDLMSRLRESLEQGKKRPARGASRARAAAADNGADEDEADVEVEAPSRNGHARRGARDGTAHANGSGNGTGAAGNDGGDGGDGDGSDDASQTKRAGTRTRARARKTA
jgi:DNA end-binding protein Ku